MFPPCKVNFEQQTKRTWFIAVLYKTAVEAYPGIKHTPIDFACKLDENHEYIQVKQFEGNQFPPQLQFADINTDTVEKENEIDSDMDNDK